MKVSLNWLTDYVDISMPAGELGKLLTRIGLSVEETIETDADIVLDIEATSNRPDCLGHLGVAREIAAATGATFRPPSIGKLPTAGNVADMAQVEVLDPDLCPRYTARLIRGVKIGPSPKWMVDRLEAIGLRSINNVVDVTNYVLMEYSQPLHSFDWAKLAGHKIIVRRARAGEVLVSIDQTTCRLDENMLIIADAEKPVAIGGVMGGLNSEVSAQTTDILLEAAQFDPIAIRYASRKLQLMSESNYRFERGVDPMAVERASLRACQLIVQTAGGKLADGVLDAWAQPWRPTTVTLRPARCNALLGFDTPVNRQVDVLAGLGLSPKVKGQTIVCTVPSHRADLSREVDLIEEIARLEGYDRIPVYPKVTHTVAPEGLTERVVRLVGEAMTAAGFDEAMSATFVDAQEAVLFGWTGGISVDVALRKANNVLRASVLPSLLRACKTNQDAGNTEVSLFELAGVFPAGEDANAPDEHVELGMMTTHDFRDLRGALETVVGRIEPAASVSVRHASLTGFEATTGAEILIDGQVVGAGGLVAANVLDYYGLNPDRPIAAAAVRFDALVSRAGRRRTYMPLAKFPAVKRDLSVIVDEDITWLSLVEAIARVDQPMRRAVDYVTTYRGEQIPPGRKSVTLTLTYRSGEGTLRSQEVDRQVAEVISAMEKEFAAELRE